MQNAINKTKEEFVSDISEENYLTKEEVDIDDYIDLPGIYVLGVT